MNSVNRVNSVEDDLFVASHVWISWQTHANAPHGQTTHKWKSFRGQKFSPPAKRCVHFVRMLVYYERRSLGSKSGRYDKTNMSKNSFEDRLPLCFDRSATARAHR